MQIEITVRSPEDYEKTIARLKQEGCELQGETEETSYWKGCLCTYTVTRKDSGNDEK